MPTRLEGWPLAKPVDLRYSSLMQAIGFEQALTSARRRHARRLHQMRQMLRGLPDRRAGGPRRCRSQSRGQRRARHPAVRQGRGGIREMGQGLHGERRVHQGLRLRRQSALPVDDGAARDDAERQGAGRAAQAGRHRVPQDRRGHERAVAAAALRGVVDPPWPEALQGSAAHRIARRGVLHRLQRAEDAAHRAVVSRHHGHDRHRLSGDGRTDPLLRHEPASRRRHRHARTFRQQHHPEADAVEDQAGAGVVPELRHAVRRNRAADHRARHRREAVRYDAVHAVPARQARQAPAVPEEPRRDDGGAAPASRHRRRDGSGGAVAARRARHQDRQARRAGRRSAKRQSRDACRSSRPSCS